MSRQTTRLRRPSASGRAMRREIGVTRWIHSELSRGVSTGTGTIAAPAQTALLGHDPHDLAVGEDVGPADVEGPGPTVAGAPRQSTRYRTTLRPRWAGTRCRPSAA